MNQIAGYFRTWQAVPVSTCKLFVLSGTRLAWQVLRWQGILPGGNLKQSSYLAARAIYWWFISGVGAASIAEF